MHFETLTFLLPQRIERFDAVSSLNRSYNFEGIMTKEQYELSKTEKRKAYNTKKIIRKMNIRRSQGAFVRSKTGSDK